MIYVGTPPSLNNYGYRDKCRAYIDPSLPVARLGSDLDGHGMTYWPGYSDITPQCRATYLDWLANGRSDPSYNPGYMFLYFYGLERRLLVDQSNEDAQDIIDEVRRLRSLYPGNHSAQRYLGEFLDFASVVEKGVEGLEPLFERSGWELPFSLKCALGTRIEMGKPLTWDWILSWLICHPEYKLRTPATRCPEEFRALFRLRFEQRFPEGLRVSNTPTRDLHMPARRAAFSCPRSARLLPSVLPRRRLCALMRDHNLT